MAGNHVKKLYVVNFLKSKLHIFLAVCIVSLLVLCGFKFAVADISGNDSEQFDVERASNDSVNTNSSNEDIEDCLNFTTVYSAPLIVEIDKVGSPPDKNIFYTYGDSNWNLYNFNTPLDVSYGKKVYFKSDESFLSTRNGHYNFVFQGSEVLASGKLSSLFGNNTSIGDYGCYGMFHSCTSLTTAPDLSDITSIGEEGCLNMFAYCSSLTTAPDLSSVASIGQKGCSKMFSDCSSVTTAPDLSSVASIGNYGCEFMLFNCTSLTTAPDFSSLTAISNYGCREMFDNCSSLITAPDLSNITSIGEEGCSNMFANCSSLTTAPDLSSLTAIGNYGCQYMFYSCTSLTTAPDLSSVASIGDYGCCDMFYSCTSLTTAPDLLSVASIGDYGCGAMFMKCSSLTTAPDLPSVASIGNNACKFMYADCILLSHVKVSFHNWNNFTDEWLRGVSTNGTFTCPSDLDASIRDVSHIPEGWDIIREDPYLTLTAKENNAAITCSSTSSSTIKLSYSKDRINWTNISVEGDGSVKTLADLNQNEKFYIYGDNKEGFNTSSGSLSFSSSSPVSIFGNINGLIYPGASDIPNNYSFKNLFSGWTNLQNDENGQLQLPANNLKESCYEGMFEGCSGITRSPELPASELKKNCYASMFKGCSSLIKAPYLPAKVLDDGCYMGMFEGCHSLTYMNVEFNDWKDGSSSFFDFANNPTLNWLKDTDSQNFTNEDKFFYCKSSLDKSVSSESRIPDYWTVDDSKNISVEISGTSWTYDGEDHGVDVVAHPEDATIYYKETDTDDWTTVNPQHTNVGVYKIQIKITKAEYYDFYTNAELEIRPKGGGVINMDNYTKIYGDEDPKFELTATGFGEFIPQEGEDYIIYRDAGEDATGDSEGYTIHALWLNSNFVVEDIQKTLKIYKADATLIADEKSKLEGEEDPAFTAHMEGSFLNGYPLQAQDYEILKQQNPDGSISLFPSLTKEGQEKFSKNYNVSYETAILKVYPSETQIVVPGETVYSDVYIPVETHDKSVNNVESDKNKNQGFVSSDKEQTSDINSPLSPLAIGSLIANGILLAAGAGLFLRFRKRI